MPFRLHSEAFEPGAGIPTRFTDDGRNISPPLTWSGVPQSTGELALVVDDPDAPGRHPWVHWLVYKIPATATRLPENVSASPTPSDPAGALQGLNSWGRLGYGGPAPPVGHGVHHYRFRLFALDAALDLFHSLTSDRWRACAEGRILDCAELVGTYRR